MSCLAMPPAVRAATVSGTRTRALSGVGRRLGLLAAVVTVAGKAGGDAGISGGDAGTSGGEAGNAGGAGGRLTGGSFISGNGAGGIDGRAGPSWMIGAGILLGSVRLLGSDRATWAAVCTGAGTKSLSFASLTLRLPA